MNHRSVAIKTYCTGKKNSLPNQARRRWWWRGRWEGWKQNRNMKVEVYNVFQVDVNGRTITNIWCTNSSLLFVIRYDVLKTQLVLKLCPSSMRSFSSMPYFYVIIWLVIVCTDYSSLILKVIYGMIIAFQFLFNIGYFEIISIHIHYCRVIITG